MRRGVPAGLAATALVLLAGCGGPAAGAGNGAGAGDPVAAAEVLAQVNAHNDADVTFVRDMIGHHAQGVELADLVPARTATPAVRDLAALIDRQQGVEIDQLRGQLTSWDLEPAGSSMGRSMGMAGMASPDTLARLRDTRGAAFDRLWLQTMTAHHEGAVTMARAELDAGIQRGARNTAQNVIAVQQAQIDTMKGLLLTR